LGGELPRSGSSFASVRPHGGFEWKGRSTFLWRGGCWMRASLGVFARVAVMAANESFEQAVEVIAGAADGQRRSGVVFFDGGRAKRRGRG